MVGKWEGTGKGFGGSSTVNRIYRPMMDHTFLMSRTQAAFAPTEKKPEGDRHEDVGVFSYDKPAGRVMYREFNSEGFVNTYELKSVSEDGRTFVFETVSVEGLADGWRARLTIVCRDRDHMDETFELAGPGKEFSACGTNTFVRVKREKVAAASGE